MKTEKDRAEIERRLLALAELSLEALPPMFDPGTGLFCQKAVAAGGRNVNRGANPLYTAMSAVGVLRQRLRPPEQVLPIGRALDALHGIAAGRGAPEVAAVTLWASILAEDPRGEELAAALCARGDLGRWDSAVLGHVVHALALAAEAYPRSSARTLAGCRAWVEELRGRFRPEVDLFAGLGRPSGARSALIHRLTSFAAQVYPLHGLAAYHRVTGEAPSSSLRRAGERIVAEQGPLGQWWWLYSSRKRVVLEGYPVYSVHQDGMAFMALLPLEALGEGSYLEPLARGLAWLEGENELGVDLVQREPPLISRNIQRRGSDADAMFGISRANLARVAARSLVPSGDGTAADPARLEVLRECRPYHLGWLLHACAMMGE
ncbi:MAG TPA: hypothetical protein VFT19_02165 [Solirubrobacterales bacterium]|nr:hypothetical protein [Solirubrobacterales bacterium]